MREVTTGWECSLEVLERGDLWTVLYTSNPRTKREAQKNKIPPPDSSLHQALLEFKKSMSPPLSIVYLNNFFSLSIFLWY